MYVLGIDGGGTKTAAVIADENGTVYMKAEAGRSNPNTLNKKEFEAVLTGLLHQLREQDEEIYNRLSVCFAGMAGVGESNRQLEVKRLLSQQLPPETLVYIENDAVNALYSGTLGQSGIVQISGTGAITIGKNETGEIARVGGWGYLFDDFGSGYDLGNQALQAVFQAYDGREYQTALTEKVLNYFRVERVPDTIERIYSEEHPRTIIAPLSRIVVEAASEGDSIALRIIEKASRQMAESIITCHNKLFAKEETVKVVLSGGVFTNFVLFRKMIENHTCSKLPNLEYIPSVIPPVGGAVAAGFSVMGVNLGEKFIEVFKEGVSR
ncbi:BadF/BadG/BcrA/BcrD ATPase family protein [Chungangia koreensis]|uniref:BadF/BadG/BcrA/BcrD ATPase family protein n=1 Tax=Chungangia koreensis TaxID=752657 RepID=A0ABV8X608_9LACT